MARVLRFWPYLLVVAFFHLGYHRAQFSNQERERLYQRFLKDPIGASLADPVAALRVHHVRDADEYLYLSWANLMLGKSVDRDYLVSMSDDKISLLPFHGSEGSHLLPYRDFVFQYPPLAIIPIVLPALITTDPVLYPYVFGALAGLAALVIAWAGWSMRAQPDRRFLWLSAGALFLVGVTLETRLDVFAAAIVALALWAAGKDRWVLAGMLLGIGAAVKLYPGLLFPAFAAPLVAQRRSREAFAASGAFAIAALIACLPGVLVSWSGFLHAIDLHSARGLQVESVGATAVAWMEMITGSPLVVVRAFGARDIASASWVPTLCRLLVPAMALLGAVLWWRTRTLFDGVALAIAGIWIASPVLSPQYLVWGLPVFLLVSSPAARWLYLLALAATRIEYPALYPFVSHLSLAGLIILTIRNVLLIATWVTLLTRPRDGRQTSTGFGWRGERSLHRA